MRKPLDILILEDSVLLAMELEAALADGGHRPVTAGSIAGARGRIDEGRFAVALLDLGLPDGSSLDLAAELERAGCRVAILSGFDDGAIPPAHAHLRQFPKPADTRAVLRWINSDPA